MENQRPRTKMSELRKGQLHIFILRLCIYVATIVIYILSLCGNTWAESQFDVLEGFKFYRLSVGGIFHNYNIQITLMEK